MLFSPLWYTSLEKYINPFFLTDSSLTHLDVTSVLNTVVVDGMEYCLRVPPNMRNTIKEQSLSDEERRDQLVDYWLRTSPYASWQWLSGWIHRYEEKSALSDIKRYVQRAPGMYTSYVVHDGYFYT